MCDQLSHLRCTEFFANPCRRKGQDDERERIPMGTDSPCPGRGGGGSSEDHSNGAADERMFQRPARCESSDKIGAEDPIKRPVCGRAEQLSIASRLIKGGHDAHHVQSKIRTQ